MAQALLISNNEVLNDLYSLNLEVYVGTNVTVKANLEESLKLLELNPNFNAIIVLALIDGEDAGKAVYEHCAKSGVEAPVIVIGVQSEVSKDEVSVLPASYNVRALVRTVAKLLGITAKDMAESVVPDFYPIPVKLFYSMNKIPCQVFYRVKKNKTESDYIQIARKGDSLESGVRKYIDEGVNTLYVDKMFRLEFINTASEMIINRLETEDLGLDEKIEVTEQGIEIVADSLFTDQKVTEEVINISKACIDSIGSVIESNHRLKNLLASLLANKTRYAYTHSILATYVSTHVIKNISWGGESHAEKISFVLFFHDIFLIPLYNKYPELKYEEDLLYNEKLSDKEKEIVLNHAKLAGQVVQDFPRCPMGADVLITQHHGMTGGEGFAVKYKDDISPLAKVIIVAEGFVEEMMKQVDESGSYAIADILSALKKRFSRHTYVKIIDTLESIDMR